LFTAGTHRVLGISGRGWAGTQLTALADPTRRTVFEMLGESPRAVGDLAGRLPVSRPAVSQHLKVLTDARLVRAEVDGTRRIYSVDPAGLAELRRWVETHWDVVLDRFEEAAQRDARQLDAGRQATP
jgi:DNA-binding transcriptional ArsR family regulator